MLLELPEGDIVRILQDEDKLTLAVDRARQEYVLSLDTGPPSDTVADKVYFRSCCESVPVF